MLYLIPFWSIVVVAAILYVFFPLPIVLVGGGLALWFVICLKVNKQSRGNFFVESANVFVLSFASYLALCFSQDNMLFHVYYVVMALLLWALQISWIRYMDGRSVLFWMWTVTHLLLYVGLWFAVQAEHLLILLMPIVTAGSGLVVSAIMDHDGSPTLSRHSCDVENLFGGMGFWFVNFFKYLGLAIAYPFILIYKLFKLIWEGLGLSELRDELGLWFWILFAVLIVFAVLALTGAIVKMADSSSDIFSWITNLFNNMGEFPILTWYIEVVDALTNSFLIVLLAVFVLAGFVIFLVADLLWLILCFLFTVLALIICGLLIFVFYTVLPGAAGIACLVMLIIGFSHCDKERADIALFVLLLLFIIAGVACYYVPVITAL